MSERYVSGAMVLSVCIVGITEIEGPFSKRGRI